MTNDTNQPNDGISKEILSSSQFISTVKQYHENINEKTLTLLQKEYSFLERLFGGKLIQAVGDQKLIQAKNEFALINRAHELKNEYAIDIIKQKCIANLTALASETNKDLITFVRKKLTDLEFESRNAIKEEMVKLEASYEDVAKYENDKNLYETYKKFIDDSRDRVSRVTNKLLNKFENDVDKITNDFGKNNRY